MRNLTVRYLPPGMLFPTEVPQYDARVIREALHNAIAHQDYAVGGRVNVIDTVGSGIRRMFIEQRKREELEAVMLAKLPDVLSDAQKRNRVKNLLADLSRRHLIAPERKGPAHVGGWCLKNRIVRCD